MNQSLLKLQIGPVQDFIAQARTTRDLWSGSYLLSWLMAHAMAKVREIHPQADFVFPHISEQPLVRFLEQRRQPGDTDEQILTPNLPNLFLAVLECDTARAQELAKSAEEVFHATKGEWGKIASACLGFLDSNGTSFDPAQLKRWAFQIARQWQVTWQLWPIQLRGATLQDLARRVPMLEGISASSDGWNENYQIASHRLDARRQTRDFTAWEGELKVHKDHFSGKEEAVVDSKWIAQARKHGQNRGLPFLFRSDDALCAANLIKRVWHKAYLQRVKGLNRARLAFDSVPDVAAAPWRKVLAGRLSESRTSFEMVRAFQDAVVQARGLLDEELPGRAPQASDLRADKWLANADQSLFNESTWIFPRGALDEGDQIKADTVLGSLEKMRTTLQLRSPGAYYAVLALDGDEMGKWVSGEKTGGATTREFHHEFSRKLSAFALRDAGSIAEDHEGVLVYSGGDDVLALLPATRVLECVKALLDAFNAIEVCGKRLTASAGVAIGHIKAPLQDMIQAAQEAERHAKRGSEFSDCTWLAEADAWDWPQALSGPASASQQTAKKAPESRGFGRDAFSVTLYKRSGETVRWGAKRLSAGWELLALFQKHSRLAFDEGELAPPISGRFTHRLAELLSPYGQACLNPLNRGIVLKEVAFVISQQTHLGRDVPHEAALKQLRADLANRCTAYVDELLARRRPIAEFLHLFSTEAFAARQGD